MSRHQGRNVEVREGVGVDDQKVVMSEQRQGVPRAAGFATVPEVGWKVWVSQPVAELRSELTPLILSTGPAVQVLAQLQDGRVVAAKEGHLMVTSFHPELTNDLRLHEYFVSLAEKAKSEGATTVK